MLHFIRLKDVSITWNDLYFEQDFLIMIKPDFPETLISLYPYCEFYRIANLHIL